MDGNLVNKNQSANSSLMELLKKYTTGVDERGSLPKESASVAQIDETQKPKMNSNSDQEKSTVNYKAKWEESEAKYRALENKYRQLETGTTKQLQDKIDQLQRENRQMKIFKDRVVEICSCRQLTNVQFEQLKSLLNKNNIPIETIANKNDFLQQTRKLRDVFLKHSDELLNKIDELITKKRKRNRNEDDSSDDEEENH